MSRAGGRPRVPRQRRGGPWLPVIVVGVLLLAGLVGLVVYQNQRTDDVRLPANVTADGSGVVDGNGPVQVDIWLDLHCPHCRTFEEEAGATLDQLVADGQITRVYHPVSFLDRFSTTEYSTRAAAAVGCAADANAQARYIQELLAVQPPAGGPGLDDAQLTQVGAEAGVTGEEFATCVSDERYRGWVEQVTESAARAGVTGTPTVRVNGTTVEPSAAAITAAVQAANQGG